jgi:hypothetical protein
MASSTPTTEDLSGDQEYPFFQAVSSCQSFFMKAFDTLTLSECGKCRETEILEANVLAEDCVESVKDLLNAF